MAKLKTLKGAPKSFELTVEVENLDGSKADIIFTCIGRTLREWQPIYLNRLAGEANTKIEAQEKLEQQKAEADESNAKGNKKDDAPAFKRVEFNEQEVSDTLEASFGSATHSITDVATGWDLEDEFNEENLKELISRFPGTQAKLFQQYHERILGNRAKN